jgi:uncharacterized membrane protein
MDRVFAFLHLFFAFSFVGSLVVADWNSRAARATTDWTQRAAFLDIVARSSSLAGFGSLVLLGLFGNLWSDSLGYRMADSWLQWVNGLWLVAVALMLFAAMPSVKRLARAAREAAAEPRAAEEYPQALRRWRLANAGLSVLYLALLLLMVLRWR